MKFGITTLVLALAVALASPVGAGSPSPEDVTAAEQWFVSDANRARWYPAEYAAEMSLVVNEQGDSIFHLDDAVANLKPRPPLVINQQLTASAGSKSDQTATYPTRFWASDHCYHPPEGETTCPNELVESFGYELPSYWDGKENSVELFWAGEQGATPMPPAAVFMNSRQHWLLFDLFEGMDGLRPAYRYEIGVGWTDECGTAYCPNLFVHIGIRRGTSQPRFITGVVFSDGNDNGIMDLGEGIPDVTVTVGSTSVTTNEGGGYAIEVNTGTRTVTASGGSFGSPSAATVKVGGYNVGVDFVKGDDPVVRAYEKCKGLEPTILGTSGDDILYGTPGPDVIHGLDGNDRIYGLGGNDVICGGDGKDKLFGGPGDDRLYGGRGRDVLKGDSGEDLLRGDQGKDTLKGGSGDDTLVGKGGPDKLYGGPDDDLLKGNGKADLLQGDLGDDVGIGGKGSDECHVEDATGCET